MQNGTHQLPSLYTSPGVDYAKAFSTILPTCSYIILLCKIGQGDLHENVQYLWVKQPWSQRLHLRHIALQVGEHRDHKVNELYP